ncbi:MAG: YebC/PmpR family DNA-binding transcriptional regulator [Planctomycetota bacterium]|jgi:YebC/PmpR family DNA-binding regulatory protein
MAGHSHWAGIKHKKAAVDAKRGKVFGKLSRAIIAAARTGGGDPDTNLSLRYAIDKARAANMPRDTIARAVKKGTGELEGEEILELTYEAYGPGGAGVIIQTITDNSNRTSSEVRAILEKRGGRLGKPGSVAWNFQKLALFTLPTEGVDEEQIMEVALESGADDVANEGAFYSVTAPPESFAALAAALEAAGIKPETNEVTLVPKSQVMLSADDARRMIAIIEALEDHDDVQSAITNGEIPDEVMAELGSA